MSPDGEPFSKETSIYTPTRNSRAPAQLARETDVSVKDLFVTKELLRPVGWVSYSRPEFH